jgi:ferredoxin-NADP reductase
MPDSIVVKNKIADMLAFARLVSLRRKMIRSAPAQCLSQDPVNRLVGLLHPERMNLKVSAVKRETESTRSFTLVPDKARGTDRLAAFKAGQYVSLGVMIDGKRITRNYSLSSTPREAEEGWYRITVREKKNGYVSRFLFENWKEGTEVESSGPVGNFTYEGLRDKPSVIAIAGGCGITPVYSIVKNSLETGKETEFTILYGIRNAQDIIFKDELRKLEETYGGRVKVYPVASDPDPDWKGEKGLITAELIGTLTGGVEGKSFFICGPQAMYSFLDKELAKLHLPARLVRREVFGEAEEPRRLPGFPEGNEAKTFTVRVNIADEVCTVQASGGETLLVSLERAGLEPPSRCRSGECGFCRAKLISGNVYVSPMNDGRRIADKAYGWIHPCSSYPVSDLDIRISRTR